MKEKNDASQTLFRMVSLRSPQLTEINNKNLSFIQRPKGAIGIFDTIVKNRMASSRKISAIESFIKTLEFENTAYKTEKELQEGKFGQLLIIGKKITRKENLTDSDWKFAKEFYAKLIDTNQELTSEGIKNFETLWSNLIYQTISQKDFYIKEAICDILKAIHLGFAQSIKIDEDFIKVNGEKPCENALNGKIVLPADLIIEDEVVNNQANGNKTTATNPLTKVTQVRLANEAQTILLSQSAVQKTEELKKLNEELKSAQKSYFKEKEQAYKDSYAKYLAENKEALEKQDNLIKEINRLEKSKTPAPARILSRGNCIKR